MKKTPQIITSSSFDGLLTNLIAALMNCQMTSAACAPSSDAATSSQPLKRTLSPEGLHAYKEFVCRRVRESYAMKPAVHKGLLACPDDPDWVVTKLLNEVNGSAEEFFRACQAELFWTEQIHPENLLVSFKVVGMLASFFYPGFKWDGTVDKEVEASHHLLDNPVATPMRVVSPVSVVTPPTELTTLTKKRRSRDKQKHNKKKGKRETLFCDDVALFSN